MSEPLRPNDPAYWMLEKGRAEAAAEARGELAPEKPWRSKTTVYDANCYICQDPEFALMGLPLCYPCDKCGGHVPADDSCCSVCGHDNQPENT